MEQQSPQKLWLGEGIALLCTDGLFKGLAVGAADGKIVGKRGVAKPKECLLQPLLEED